MENFVFLELIKQKIVTNNSIFYFQTRESYEIDFLTNEGNRITKLIQVTYTNVFDEVDPRKGRAQVHAYELFKSHKPECIIITLEYEDEKISIGLVKKLKLNLFYCGNGY